MATSWSRPTQQRQMASWCRRSCRLVRAGPNTFLLLFNVTNRSARILTIADAGGPRSIIAFVLAAVIWSIFVIGFVRGLSRPGEPSPPAIALDARIVQLAPTPAQRSPAASIVTATVQRTAATVTAPPRPARAAYRVAKPVSPITSASPPRDEPKTEPKTDSPAPSPAVVPSTPTAAHPDEAEGSIKAPAGNPSNVNSGTPGDGAAHAILQPLPVLPDDLREDAYQTVAMARFSIRVDGSADVELVKPTQNPRLNQLLLEALRKWRFFPAMKDGRPVVSSQEIRVHFNVD